MSLQSAIQDGMAASFAARLDPMTSLTQTFMSTQMQIIDDQATNSRMDVLERLELKVEKLKAEGADGRTIEAYQSMHERLAASQGARR